MKQKIILFLGLLCFLAVTASSHAHFNGKGHVHDITKKTQTFLNIDCAKSGTCDLKRFTIISIAYEVWFMDDPIYPTYGNGTIIEYETESLVSLEKYAVVQFMRGGLFYTAKKADGTINKFMGDVVLSFGEKVPFFFPEWVIDSQDADPVYNSDPDYGRFYLLRWNEPYGLYDNRTRKFYGQEKPNFPTVYLTDYLSGAFVTGIGVKNAAMEFKTCISKTDAVPVKTVREDINFAKGVICFEWQNINVYDHATGKFLTDPVDIPKLFKELNIE